MGHPPSEPPPPSILDLSPGQTSNEENENNLSLAVGFYDVLLVRTFRRLFRFSYSSAKISKIAEVTCIFFGVTKKACILDFSPST